MKKCNKCHASDYPDTTTACTRCGHSPLTPYRKRNLSLHPSDFIPLGTRIPEIKSIDDTAAIILPPLCALLLVIGFIILPLLSTHRIVSAGAPPMTTHSPVITQEVLSPTDTPTPTPTPTNTPTNTPTPVIQTLTSQQTQSETVKATGQGTTPGTQASGMLLVRNPYSGTPKGVDITLNAGTVFDDDTGNSPNVQMMLNATITVPGDGTQVTVSANVVQIGAIGNISQIRGWTHYGAYTDPAPLDLDIDNSTSFTGGKDPQPYNFVQQSDIDNAVNYLETINQKNAIANINSQLQSGEHLVKDPQCNSDIIPDHVAGDHTDIVNVRVDTTCKATAST